MNLKNILISIVLLYFLVLLQTSFFVHFSLWGRVPNLVIVLIILWNIFEKDKTIFSLGILAALIGGFFLDIFSGWFFGIYIIILALTAVFIKKIIKNYVRIPWSEKI